MMPTQRRNGMMSMNNDGFLARKLLSIASVLVMILGMVACGGTNPDSDNRNPGETLTVVFQNPLPDPFENLVAGDINSDAPDQAVILANLAEAQEINADAKAWLYLPNTTINDVVLQSTDNDYYLRRNVYRNYTLYGCYFADFRSKLQDGNLSPNIVIYGHSFDDNPDGLLFSQFKKYLNIDFARSNPIIYLTTSTKEYQFQVFAIFYTDLKFYYWDVDASPASLQNIITEAKLRSQLTFDVDVNANDTILTLSTCTYQYGRRDDQRCVLMARLLRNGESIPNQSPVTVNPNPKQPTF